MKKTILILTITSLLFASLFLYSYNFNWNYERNLPKIISENKEIILLQIDSIDHGEYFHRRYSHEYPESPFDYYLLDGKSYFIEELSVSKGCYTSEGRIWRRCLYFMKLSKTKKILSLDEFYGVKRENDKGVKNEI